MKKFCIRRRLLFFLCFKKKETEGSYSLTIFYHRFHQKDSLFRTFVQHVENCVVKLLLSSFPINRSFCQVWQFGIKLYDIVKMSVTHCCCQCWSECSALCYHEMWTDIGECVNCEQKLQFNFQGNVLCGFSRIHSNQCSVEHEFQH